jgi:type I restriction-modification system DNA methylase subunit
MSSRVTLSQIVDNITQLSVSISPDTFIYDFLLCFGMPKATIARLKATGGVNVAKRKGCTLLKAKIYFEPLSGQPVSKTPMQVIEAAQSDPKIIANKPRFLVATDFKMVAAYDTKQEETLQFPIADLPEHYVFFLPLAGMEKINVHAEAEADVKAAENMAKLYDLIRADNPPKSRNDRHALNVFLTRLLFCYFAEDTNIFPEKSFTHAVASFTQEDGSDLQKFLQQLFLVLNTETKDRSKTAKHLAEFPYVNGGLFSDTHAHHLDVPQFSAKSRMRLIDLGSKSWKEINPDIFGSMFQGVVDDEKRAELGMHYTSVPNILRLIKPLFLDELYEELEKAKGSESKLKKLLSRLYQMRFFDPACGSGNFLIIAYKEIRRLEMAAFKELEKVEDRSLLKDSQTGFDGRGFRPVLEQAALSQTTMRLPGIHVSQFYGIELDDFAHEIAILALWLAEHQMNLEFKERFGDAPPSLPLKDGAKIFRDDATRLDWEKVCPKENGCEVIGMGNPPYLGSSLQDGQQKEDMEVVFRGIDNFKNLDYIACWFFKAAGYLKDSPGSRFAFVSTNSICQGEQVASLWPHIFSKGIEIGFTHLSFKWANNAKNQAAVICVIIGLQKAPVRNKRIYDGHVARTAENINAYLVNARNVAIAKRRTPISRLRPMDYGSKPADGGNLLFSKEERDHLLKDHPELKKVIRRFAGAEDYIDGFFRYCLWMTDEDATRYKKLPEIKDRLSKVRKMREDSDKEPTRRDADFPHRFSERRHVNAPSIIIPIHSSERRTYIPFGYLEKGVVIANSALAIYDAEPWLFGIISSQMHMAWVHVVAGRIKSDFRYSNTLCYNNFPFPQISDEQTKDINRKAEEVLSIRERHHEKTIAWLYDPDTMPGELLSAHRALDEAVERCYRAKPFASDDERLEFLFALYEQMAASDGLELFARSVKEKAKRKPKNSISNA